MKKSTGKQSNEYFKEYYKKNKERINARNKAKYYKDRSDPEKLKEIRKSATKATKKYREKNREKVNEYSKKRHAERKYSALSKIGNGKVKCANCGCDAVDFLEINHINGGGCKEHKESKRSLKDAILNGTRETKDLNILCRVCNALDYLKRKNNSESKRYKILWD